ncbi:MAG TPA: class I SAM-dependent methyltransferase [Chloroflexota bacterium]
MYCRLERQRVHELLDRYMPMAPARVADIGGGPGVHANWLIDQGYEVELLDPVRRHVDQARALGLSAVVGDARRLPWGNESMDAVLMASPMYRLTRASDRCLALREAVRVVRPGGVVAAIAINRVADLIGLMLADQLQERREIVEEILDDGYSVDDERMPTTACHTVTQLRTEMSQVLSTVTIHGLTGLGGWLTVVIDAHFKDRPLPGSFAVPDPLQTALACARVADNHPELVHASSLLFAVGRRA